MPGRVIPMPGEATHAWGWPVNVPSWLSHLRTDRRGIPVPYVNLWGTEDLARMSVRHDRHVGGDAAYIDDADQQVPDFTRQCMQRQRECVLAGLCQVCGRGVPWSRRHLVVADMSVDWVDIDGHRAPVVTEPWLCERCAHFALRRCPALIRRTRSERLTLVAVTSRRQVRMVHSVGWLDGPLREQTQARPVALWSKITLLHVAIQPAGGGRP